MFAPCRILAVFEQRTLFKDWVSYLPHTRGTESGNRSEGVDMGLETEEVQLVVQWPDWT